MMDSIVAQGCSYILLLAKKNLEWRNQFMTFKEQFWEELEEAKEIGAREARAEVSLKSAENLLKMNLGTPEQIAQAVNLPLEQSLSIKENLLAEPAK